MGRIASIAGALFALAAAWPAQVSAMATIQHVEARGSDASGDGSLNNPFRTLAKAVSAAQSGDIIQLGKGEFGPAVITNKSLTIISAESGSIVDPGSTAITFNGGANRELTLRGLTIDQGGTANSGIRFNSGRKLLASDLDIRNGTGGAFGVDFRPTDSSEIILQNIKINGFGTSGAGSGINIAPRSANVTGTLVDGILSNNRTGVRVFSGNGSTANVVIDGYNITGGTTGISASGPGSQIVINESVITHNALGVEAQNSAQIRTRVNNTNFGNALPGTPTGTWPPW
jgi:hypothetical protein